MLFFKKHGNGHTEASDIIDGEKQSHRILSPLKDIDGLICEFEYHENHDKAYTFILQNKNLKGSFSESSKGVFSTDRELSDKEYHALDLYIKDCGITKFNGWNVTTAGLPPSYDAVINASFTSGEHLYMTFNGGDAPEGYSDSSAKLIPYLSSLLGYDPSMLQKPKPHTSPFIGTHHFTHSVDGTIREQYRLDISEGTKNNLNLYVTSSHGDFTILGHASKLYSASYSETCSLTMEAVLSGHPDRRLSKGDLLGHLEYNAKSGLIFKTSRLTPKNEKGQITLRCDI